MIRLDNVSKTYRTDKVETLALKDISLHVKKGAFLSIMGPSGCGKSTLLNVIGLLDAPGSGSVQVDGKPVTTYRDTEVVRGPETADTSTACLPCNGLSRRSMTR